MNAQMSQPSHRITDAGDKIVIHDLEVFCAYDPNIDGDHDDELKAFTNERVQDIVASTQRYMEKGSYPRLVVMHERDGKEPKSSVGRFTNIAYQDRDGVGYIVGDCEVERGVFDKLLATNAFPRRSAEIWQDHNHLSEVALLGRETPRRPLPDTHFARKGERVTFSRSLRFDMGTVGGGLSTFVPGTEKTKMADNDIRSEMSALKASLEELASEFKKRFADDADDKDEMMYHEREENDTKETMDADDMLAQQFAEEEGDGDGIHIDIDSHGDEDEEEEEDQMITASRRGRPDVFALRRENRRMARELAEIRAELSREKFSRELDAMEQEGYRIPTDRRPQLISELSASVDPAALLDTWRELFARDPMGVRIDMSRAKLPESDIDSRQIGDLVREFAGKPEEFRKAINNRMKQR
jgi:hypothetical protein